MVNMKKGYKMQKGRYWSHDRQRWEKVSTANQALKIAKKVDRKQKQQTEMAIVDKNVSGTLSAVGLVTHVDVGLSPTVTLEGTDAYIKGIRIKGHIEAQSTDSERWRVDLVLDRRPIPGTLATFSEIYTVNNDINSIVNKNNISRFKILATERGYVNANDVGQAFFDRHVKLNLKICTKVQGSYVQSNQNKNAILVMVMTDATASQPTYAYQLRNTVLDN